MGEVLGIGAAALTVWNIAKWPVLGILAIAPIAVLYYVTANVRQPKFRWISVGATVALLPLSEVGAELERARQLQAGIKAEVELQLPPRDTLTSAKKRGKQLALVAQGRQLRPDLTSEGDRPASGSTEARAPWWLAVAGAAAIAMTALRNRRRTR